MTDAYTVLDIETDGTAPWRAKLLRVGIGDTAWRSWSAATRKPSPVGRRKLLALMARPGVIVEQTMFDARWGLLDGAALGPETDVHDLRTMAWLLDEEQSFKLADTMLAYLGEHVLKPIVQRANVPVWDCDVWPIPGRKGTVPLDEVPDDIMDEYNGGDLDEEGRLYECLRERLDEEQLWELFLRDEVPLSRALVEMEAAGLPFDGAESERLRAKVRGEADELGAQLVAESGIPGLNLGSTKQMSELLFTRKGGRVEVKAALTITDRMRAAVGDTRRKTKDDDEDPRAVALNRRRRRADLPDGFEATRVGRDYVHGVWVGEGRGLKAAEHGFGSSTHWKQKAMEHARPSTSSVSLVLTNPDDAFVSGLVFWRELDKLEGSFLSKFPRFVDGGRLYGTVNRCGTVTGRFSSAEPNLQNIPAHGEYGAAVRELFKGRLALGDYAQLEQRVAAHYSEDPALLRAYTEGIDLYGLAASMLFGGEPTKDHPQRGLMKTGMLSLQYGAGAGKLAQLMKIDGHGDATPEDAKELIKMLRRVFTIFFAWREDVIGQAVRLGYVQTIGGRYRRLNFPDGWSRRRRNARQFYSKEDQAAGFAMERQAINAVCQGSAADIVAGAMVATMRHMPDEVATLVQVHDEIVWERLRGWGRGSLAKLRKLCETGHGYGLNVELVFEAQLAKTWADKGGGATNANSLFREQEKGKRSEGLQSRKASGMGVGRDALLKAQAGAKKSRTMGNGGRKARRAS